VAGAGQKRGRRGIIGGYWGGYSLLSLSPTHRALPGKVENLTPPANGKIDPVERCQRHPCPVPRAGGSGAAGSVPAPERGADTRRPRYAPGRTRRSRSHRQCRQKARAAAHNAPPPWPFSFAPPSRLPGLPDQQPGARWVLPATAPGKSWKVPGERWTQCMDIAPTTCTGKDRHRQRRTR
jgi:hypothetical protein